MSDEKDEVIKPRKDKLKGPEKVEVIEPKRRVPLVAARVMNQPDDPPPEQKKKKNK